MNSAAAIFTQFLLMLPTVAAATLPDAAGPSAVAAPAYRPASADQVRIEQQLTIRIGPRRATLPPPEVADDPDRSEARFSERKLGKCVPVSAISGVQPATGNRLLLIMRDQRLVTASLGKGCRSRDYYSGFIVARNGDGMICTGRDQLLSRSGANCRVDAFRLLVPVGD